MSRSTRTQESYRRSRQSYSGLPLHHQPAETADQGAEAANQGSRTSPKTSEKRVPSPCPRSATWRERLNHRGHREHRGFFYYEDARAQRNPGFQFPRISLLFSAVALSTFESFCLRGRVDWLCDLRALVGELVSLRLGDFVANVPSGPSTPSTLLKLAIVLDSLLWGNSDLPRGGAAAGEIARARRNAVGNLLSPWKRYRKRVCYNAAYGRR